MATKTLGTAGTLTVGGSEPAWITNVSFSVMADEVEVTNNDSTGAWKEFLMGNRTGTFSFTCVAGAEYGTGKDAAQVALVDALFAASMATAAFIYYPAGNTTNYYKYSFSGYVQQFDHNASNNERNEISFTIRVSGAVAVAAVAP